MPDIPRDPRQLARDILSGKVSLEDLAKEARRRGQTGGTAPGPAPAPPRPQGFQQQPARPQPPRPAPPRPQQRQNIPRTVPPPRQQPQPQRPKITYAQPPRPQRVAEVATALVEPLAPLAPIAPQTSAQIHTRKAAQKSPLRVLLGTKSSARRAILLAEVLNKPISLRD